MFSQKTFRAAGALSLAFLFSFVSIPAEAQNQQNIVEIAVSTENTSILATAIQNANLVDTLSSEGPFTVFAPTNQAFSNLGNTLDILLLEKNRDLLTDVLTYHVVGDDVPASIALTLDSAESVQGDQITLGVEDDLLFLNSSAEVISTDIEASNGRIHLIDEVILSSSLSERVQAAVTEESRTVVDIASEEESTSSLEEALEVGDLTDTLSSMGPYTVFAPTNEAFENLGDKLDVLLEPENKELLRDILTYHVVSGDISSTEVVNLSSANSLGGDQIQISTENDVVKLNSSAEVITTDIEASNGRIHLINEVILSSNLSERLDTAVNETNGENNNEIIDWNNPWLWTGVAGISIIVVVIVIVVVTMRQDKKE